MVVLFKGGGRNKEKPRSLGERVLLIKGKELMYTL